MTLTQKISLSILVVSTLMGVVIGLAIKGCDIEGEDKWQHTFSVWFSYCFFAFISSAIVLVLSFIWT